MKNHKISKIHNANGRTVRRNPSFENVADNDFIRIETVKAQKTHFPVLIKNALSEKQIAWRLFITCWLIFSLHFATNTVREIYPALSLGDHFSFDVSEYKNLHPDIFEIENRGSFINNNPGASMMGAVPYFLLRPLTDRIIDRVRLAREVNPIVAEASDYETVYPLSREFYRQARARGFDIKFGLAAAEMQFFVMSPISALSAVVMFQIFLFLTGSKKASLLLALVYAFGTPIFYRSAQLNQNLLVAHFALFSFALLWRPRKRQKPLYALAGLCAGWTLVLDYSGLVVIATLSVYAVSRWYAASEEKRSVVNLLGFFGGISIGVLILMAYQWSSFGSPFFPAQSYMPPANYTEIGYRGFAFPQADLLYETAFGLRYGLFTSAPILLLAFLYPIRTKKKNIILPSRELFFAISFITLFFLFCAANQYGRMQFNSGVRHIVPVVPFLFLFAGIGLLKIQPLLRAVLAVAGVYWSWCLAMYRDVEQGGGIFEAFKHITLEGFRLPWLTTLERMGYVQNASALPLLLLILIFLWCLWRVPVNSAKSSNIHLNR